MKILIVGIAVFVCLVLTILKIINVCKNKKSKIVATAKVKSRKFLFLKGEQNKITSDIKLKIENNAPKVFDAQIDYKKLKSSGLFEEKPIYKIFVSDLCLKNKKMIFTLNSICKKICFTPVVLCNSDEILNEISKEYKNVKCLNVNDLNPHIIFELNKIDINYKPKFEDVNEGIFVNGERADNYRYKDLRLESKSVLKSCDVQCYKILDFDNSKTIFQKPEFKVLEIIKIQNTTNKTQIYNLKINLKLDSEFININKINNKLIIKKFDNSTQIFHFSNNNFNYFIKKHEKNVFLSVKFANFKINSNSYSIMNISTFDAKIKSIKLMLLENYCKMKKLFALNFSCSSKKISKLLNENLEDIYVKHYFNFDKNKSYKFDNIIKIEQIEKLSAVKFHSFEFATFLFNEFLGIKQFGSCFKISPKSDINFFSFELELSGKKYQIEYKQNKQKYITYGGLEFVNLDNVNLKFVSENSITFCG